MCECEYCNCGETNVLLLQVYIIGEELHGFCRECDENH